MYSHFWQCLVPEWYVSERNKKKSFKFIWNGKPNKVKNKFYDMLIREGSATTCWYQKLFHSSEGILVRKLVTGHLPNWKLIPLKYFNATGKNWLLFNRNLDSTKSLNYLKNIPEFYWEIVKCWWGSNKITCHIHKHKKNKSFGVKSMLQLKVTMFFSSVIFFEIEKCLNIYICSYIVDYS